MKKIYKIFLVFISLNLMMACDNSDIVNSFIGDQAVFFEVASISIGEGGTTISSVSGTPVTKPSVAEITIFRQTPDASAALTVNFAITSKFMSDSDFANAGDDASSTFITSANGTAVIPAGEYSTTFTVTAINDLLSSGDKEVVLNLTGVDGGGYSLGTQDGGPLRKLVTLTISDDDCPIDIATDWAGTYTVTDVAPAGSTNDGFNLGANGFYSGDITLELDPSDPAAITAILKNDGSSNVLAGDTKMVFNTCPETVDLTLDFGFTVSGSPASLVNMTIMDFDASSNTVSLQGNLINTGGSNFGTWTFSFAKQ